jgi:hypothetical protein
MVDTVLLAPRPVWPLSVLPFSELVELEDGSGTVELVESDNLESGAVEFPDASSFSGGSGTADGGGVLDADIELSTETEVGSARVELSNGPTRSAMRQLQISGVELPTRTRLSPLEPWWALPS